MPKLKPTHTACEHADRFCHNQRHHLQKTAVTVNQIDRTSALPNDDCHPQNLPGNTSLALVYRPDGTQRFLAALSKPTISNTPRH